MAQTGHILKLVRGVDIFETDALGKIEWDRGIKYFWHEIWGPPNCHLVNKFNLTIIS